MEELFCSFSNDLKLVLTGERNFLTFQPYNQERMQKLRLLGVQPERVTFVFL